MSQFTTHLFRPATGGAAAVVVSFATLIQIAIYGGILGLPLCLILMSWFFKYAYIVFDRAARGFDDPPVLDIQMMNPLNEQRPLGQLLIATIVFFLVFLAFKDIGRTIGTLAAIFAALLLPASIAVLGLEGNVLKAANPVAWLRIATGMGPLYALLLVVIAGYALLLALAMKLGLWNILQLALSMFCVLSIFSLLGGFVFERRDELGIEAWTSPERAESVRQEAVLRDSERQVTEAYGKARSGSHIEAWQMLQTWLTKRGLAPDDYRWLANRVRLWEDSRYITRLTEDQVERLLALQRNGEALDVVANRLADDPSFRPKTASSTLQIAQLAAVAGGKKPVTRALTADFSNRFAGDSRIAVADALARELAG